MSVIQLQIRRDTSANWTSNNPTLASGEFGLETNTLAVKLGDGTTAWTSLAYYSTKIRAATGAPAGGLGVVGDLYINTTNSDLYLKTGVATWTLQSNLQGIQGIQGIQGNPGVVQAVTAADSSIVVGGTVANPTIQRGAITGDATASAGSNNMTNTKMNGVAYSGLATGLVKNTTGTGVPSIATAGTDYLAPAAIGTTIQAFDADLSTLAGLTPTTNNTIQAVAGSWASVTPTAHTATLDLATTALKGLQSAPDKLKEDNMWYDIVADGGADRTGSVDATSIIQAAINAVAAAGGGVVYIPRGTYKVSSAITITGNFVTVRGASRVASKLVPTHTTGNVFTVSGIFSRFEYIRIEPTSFTARTTGYAVEFTSTASNCGCQWVDILGMWSGIKASGQLCRLEDMNIRECGYGAINGCIVLIDTFTDQYLSKIVCDNGTVGPNAPMAGFSGVRVTSLSSLLMSDCQIIHCGIGMDVVPTGTNSVPSIYCMNTFFDQGTYGARFTPGSGSIVRCRFIGVWFSGNSVAGVQLNGVSIDGLDFIGCEFYGAPSQPVGIEALAATEWSVRASRFAGAGTNAIRTTAGATHSFSITDCIIGAVAGVPANAQGVNVQAGTYKRYQILDNRGFDSNTTKGIIDLGVVAATDQKNVANNMGAVLKGAIATLAAPLSVPITTETLVLSARIPANGVSVGQVFRLKAIGVMSGANAVTWKAKVGALGTAAGDVACWTPTIAPVGAANLRHSMEVYLTVRSLGAPGSVNAEGLQQSGATAVAITYQQPAAGAATTAAATTTADWFIDITLTQTVGTSLIQEAVIEAL